MITKEKTEEIITKFGGDPKNSGKTQSQIAIMTWRINDLTQHLDTHKKDHHGRRGLIMLVSKRRKLLTYLSKKNINDYRQILVDLSLRK